MKKAIYLLAILLLLSCSTNEKSLDAPKQVIIAGKVLNYNSENRNVQLSVNRLGLGSLQIITDLDSVGNFHTSFESYVPTDVWVLYKTNFLVLTHPGDSIYVVFDGNPNNRPAVLETIDFSGDAVKTNQQASKFQQMYFSNPIYNDWDSKQKAIKKYEVDQYLMYLDTLQRKADTLYNSFVNEVSTEKEVQIWAKTYVEQDYYSALAWYPYKHLQASNLNSSEWTVPDSYYDALLSRLPIKREMFISGNALSSFINIFHHKYTHEQIFNEEENKQYKIGEYIVANDEIRDSLSVYGVIKHTPDPLLRQMVLTELITQQFNSTVIRVFEKYEDLLKSTITEPFLIEPLLKHYTQIKEQLENPKVASDAMLKTLSNSSAQHIMDSIVFSNKDKVIYLDCWATWCGPCLEEMPNSKILMEKMGDKDVAFVFLCLDSEEKAWKATLAKLQLPGQHYLLTRKQSSDIQKTFEIGAIPYYALINKEGTILEKGSHLRPGIVEGKIKKLLEE